MRRINEVIIHCSATQPDWRLGQSFGTQVAEIRRWHVELNGWSDIGYHYLIGRDGRQAIGRPTGRTGAHVRGHNSGTIGICLLGGHGSSESDAFFDHFTEEQDNSLRNLIADLQETFGDIKISGHNQYAAKACPGFHVPTWYNSSPKTGEEDEQSRLRWRLAEIRDLAIGALDGK